MLVTVSQLNVKTNLKESDLFGLPPYLHAWFEPYTVNADVPLCAAPLKLLAAVELVNVGGMD